MICDTCKAEKRTKGKHPPKGWKRNNLGLWCQRCWKDRYVLYAIAMPIAAIVETPDGPAGTNEEAAVAWKRLWKVLHEAWALTTQCSNWMMTQLYSRDIRRDGQEKMPPMQHVYLYPEARKLFPGLPSQSVASLEQAVVRKYKEIRYGLIWRHAVSLPSHRYPTPFPVHNQSWSTLPDGTMGVSVPLPDGRWKLRLAGGAAAPPTNHGLQSDPRWRGPARRAGLLPQNAKKQADTNVQDGGLVSARRLQAGSAGIERPNHC